MLQTILLLIILVILLIILVFTIKAAFSKESEQVRKLIFQIEQLLPAISKIEGAVKSEIATNRLEQQNDSKNTRQELTHALQSFEYKLTFLTQTMEKKLFDMQQGNEKKLDQMRATVDEKLQRTLETRLGESFRMVSERLEAVQKGLGAMQQLATGVGDLKRVLTNVKTRGVLGEYQLQNILEQLLTPQQYGRNVKTKHNSAAMVEFAVKLPGVGADKDKVVWLPIDAKFPKEDFELLTDAYEQAQPDLIEEYSKSFIRGIKKCAADIAGKYIDPPNTTDFALLFLPFESLYAEVLRSPGLFEQIQREYKVIVTGPTTLSAIMSSLQMGFKTLAIEKRSSEVWDLLGAVKTEFGNFGTILDRTQKKMQEASNVIDEASRRSRAIERKLKDVQALPPPESGAILGQLP